MPHEMTIDAAGRLVIPRDVIRRFHLSAGTRLKLIEDGEQLVLVPQQREGTAVEKGDILVFRGRLLGDFPSHRKLRDLFLAFQDEPR